MPISNLHRIWFAAVALCFACMTAATAVELAPTDFHPSDFPLEEKQTIQVRTLLLLDMDQQLEPLKISEYREILARARAAFSEEYGVTPAFKIENYIMPRSRFLGRRFTDLCAGEYSNSIVPKSKKIISELYFDGIPKAEYCYYNYDFFKLHLRELPADVTLTNYLLLNPARRNDDTFITSTDAVVSSSQYLEMTLLSVFPYYGSYDFLADDPRRATAANERLDRLAFEVARRLSRTALHLGEVESKNCLLSADYDAAYAAFTGEGDAGPCGTFRRSLRWDVSHMHELIEARRYRQAADKLKKMSTYEYSDTNAQVVMDMFAVLVAGRLDDGSGAADGCADFKLRSDSANLEHLHAYMKQYVKEVSAICAGN